MSILIVDDSVVIRKTLTMLLRKSGYEELVSLSSASEARSYLDAQKEGEVELVLLDFQMPDETGLELLTQLKGDTICRSRGRFCTGERRVLGKGGHAHYVPTGPIGVSVRHWLDALSAREARGRPWRCCSG